MEREKIKGKAEASASWARLIHEIFEVDPLLCPNCGKEMKIIAFITNHQEVKKFKYIGEENERAPPLPAIMRYELEDSYDWETSRQMKPIFVMQNRAFKPQGSPCLKSSISGTPSGETFQTTHPIKKHTKKSKKRLPEICLYKPTPRCYRFIFDFLLRVI